MISTDLKILPDRLFIQANTDSNIAKRQTASIEYSILAPVIFTANVMNSTLVDNVTQAVSSIDVSTNSSESETIEFKAVGMLKLNSLTTYCHRYITAPLKLYTCSG